MKMRTKLQLLFLFFLSIVPGYAFAHGVHKNPISDSYNNQIIPDGEFRAKGTMNQAQIQSFLQEKGSALASYTFVLPDNGSSPWIGPGDTVDARGKSAAEIIYLASQWYNINPQVILATLQKESSIITSGNLNYLNTAMGYGCPEGGSCSPTYANFARQVDYGVWQFDYNYRYSELNDASRVGQYRAGNTATIDGKSTYISNSATASLYRYTPHRPDSAWLTATDGNHYYGNYNFIYFYNLWFDFDAYLNTLIVVYSPLNLSNYNPAIGETVTASFYLKNNTTSDLSIEVVEVANWYNWPLPNVRDFGSISNQTLAPNQIKRFSFSRTLKDLGPYHAWIRLKVEGAWFAPSSNIVMPYRDYSTRLPNLKQTWYSISPSSPNALSDTSVSLSVTNIEPKEIRIDKIIVANWLNWPQPNIRDFGYSDAVTIGPNSYIFQSYAKKLEPGNYKTWPIVIIGNTWLHLNSSWGYPSQIDYAVSEPNIKATYFLIPQEAKVNQIVQPVLRVKNFETQAVTLNLIGIASWLNWPSPNIRDFGFRAATIPAGAEVNIDLGQRTFSEIGNYRVWAIYKMGSSWYQLYHTTGYPDTTWMKIKQ